MLNNNELFDLWERDDEKSLAPLSSKQQSFLDSLITSSKVRLFGLQSQKLQFNFFF